MSSERTLRRKRRKQIEKEVDELVDYIKANKASTVAGAGLAEEVTQTSPPRSSSVGSGGGRGGVRGTSTKKGKKGKEKGVCDVLVKLGGAAVTNKSELETLDEDTLSSVIRQIAAVHRSRRLVVVHGAGSFGHFQAKEFGVQGGSLEDPRVVRGFAETRASVTKLNTKIVDALVREKVNAVGLSPCAFWDSRGCSAASVEIIRGLVGRGFVPVLHGDAIACGDRSVILSGDKIVADLAEVLRPKVVLFLSNVNGIYNKPPSCEGAILIPRIEVFPNGWSCVGIEFESAAHDTTGGMQGKVEEAAAIALGGVDVVVARAGSEAALVALRGKGDLEDGTLVTSMRPRR
mmetsp:Transcript_3104/g.10742  ORF Transcript_3104/g.10742 Transcript_3104/m.10742 type:complete len:346 (-) Transcript_3104:1535-2572(-)